MAFIDEITLNISAGNGGDGIVSWMHTKGIDHAGPGGGDGGRGGDVYLKGVRDIARLSAYRFIKDFKAENGENGKGDCMHGASGKDLVLELPLGSVLKNTETGEETEVLSEETIFFLKGGNGGYGNTHFKGSKNVNPQERTLGKDGQSGIFFIELKMIVDIGLVGFPNAGKSSLLNEITNANAKIGSYQFTTLTPNLGSLYGYVIADIPGLIEGAGEGKGLGHKFLRHISRTKMLLHCISCEFDDPLTAYKTIRDELGAYDVSLLDKPEVILLTKTDLIDQKELKSRIKLFEKQQPLKASSHTTIARLCGYSGRMTKEKAVFDISILDEQSVKKLSEELVKILKKM